MEKLLTPTQLCDLLQVRSSTLYKWTHQEFVPHIKLGRFLRFRESEILEWLEQRKSEGRALGSVKVLD